MTAGQNELRYLRYYYGDDLRDEGILSKALDKVSDVLDKITKEIMDNIIELAK